MTVPPHRLDIQAGTADLIEDLARIHGYDRLPATLLADQLPEQHANRSLEFEERVRDILVNADLQEVITYALTDAGARSPYTLRPVSRRPGRVRRAAQSDQQRARGDAAQRAGRRAGSRRPPTCATPTTCACSRSARSICGKPGQKLPDEPRRLALVLDRPAPAGVLGRWHCDRDQAARLLRPQGRDRGAGRRPAPAATCRSARRRRRICIRAGPRNC